MNSNGIIIIIIIIIFLDEELLTSIWKEREFFPYDYNLNYM